MVFVAYYTLKLDVMVVVTCYALKAWHNGSCHLLHTQDRNTGRENEKHWEEKLGRP